MTRLIIVPASEVGDRPRFWFVDRDEAQRYVDAVHAAGLTQSIVVHMHVAQQFKGREWAVVAMAGDDLLTAPTPDPRAEAFWSAAFCAVYADGGFTAAEYADAALVEWRKRWGAK